jgi:hypothetical protein
LYPQPDKTKRTKTKIIDSRFFINPSLSVISF